MNELDNILRVASVRVLKEYFQLPIDGAKSPIYRERVYCYEMYHQMRTLWPATCAYSLGGEVDKAGHPLIRGNGLDRAKPDFLVHTPGDMNGNYAVIEVKPCNARVASIKADIKMLSQFLDHAGYQRGICYIYGDSAERLLNRVNGALRDGIEVWTHKAVGTSACRMR